MASGINSTFRQIGIATGIALLGTLFSSRLRDAVAAAVHAHPVGIPAERITGALQNGDARSLFARASATGGAPTRPPGRALNAPGGVPRALAPPPPGRAA